MSKERELLKKLRYATHLEDDLRKELEELLAQPETKQEPVAWHYIYDDGERTPTTYITQSMPLGKNYTVTPLYVAPQNLEQPPPITPRQGLEEYKRGYAQAELDLKREPLSESRIAAIWNDSDKTDVAITRAIEKLHGIGVDDE